MRILIALILIAAAGIIFFVPTQALLEEVQPLELERDELNAALRNAKEIAELRQVLEERYNNIPGSEIEKIDKKFLPSHVDSVRVILEIDSIAAEHDLILRSIGAENTVDTGRSATGPAVDIFGTLDLRLTLEGDYASFKSFLADVERSLRIVDVRQVLFSANDADPSATVYAVTVRTYWLPQEK